MPLSNQPSLRARILPRFPAQVVAGSGMTIERNGGVYTFHAGVSANDKLRGYTAFFSSSQITPNANQFVFIPVACTLKSVTVLLDGVGSCVMDIHRCVYDNYPFAFNSICGNNKPSIPDGLDTKFQDTVLNGWTKTINSQDILKFLIAAIGPNVHQISISLLAETL
jgi:hypothetical protein